MTVPSDGTPIRLLSPSPLPHLFRPLGGAEPDVLRAMLEQLVQEQVTRQFESFLQASPYERSAERQGVRNGSRSRTLVTRVGALRLRIPRDRSSMFQPDVFQRYARHEQALIATLAECYLQGVSTRKVRQVVETLCGETVSASLVSSATKRLDVALKGWRSRRLDAHAMPYLIIDAHYERIRREGQVLSTAALWVIGVRADGYREYLGCWLGNAESTASWGGVLKDLLARGLHGVRYVVSDEHHGLRSALQRYLPDAVQQRCQVHYMRNAMAKVSTPAKQRELLDALRDVWAAPTRVEAEARGAQLVSSLHTSLPVVAEWLETTLHETLNCYALINEPQAYRRLRTTNTLEREHEEIRRRTRVIRIFPNSASYLRIVTALAADRSDTWTRRRYFIPTQPIVASKPTRRKRAA